MQILVVEEQLRHKGQILTVDRILVAIDFKNCHIVLLISVDLIARRMEERTGLVMPLELDLKAEEA